MIMIACVDKNWGIGYKGNLLYHITEDMKRFRLLTWNKTVIMGRKTFESIGKPLISRNNIVITNQYIEMNKKYKDFDDEFSTKITFMSMDMLKEKINNLPKLFNENTYVIGGASIYNELMRYVNKIELTLVHPQVQVDLNNTDEKKIFIKEYAADAFLYGFEFYSKNPKYKNGTIDINSVEKLLYHNFEDEKPFCKEFVPKSKSYNTDGYLSYDFITLSELSYTELPSGIIK